MLGDSDGRFAVWAERLTGKLNVTAFENEPGKPWAKDDYYTLPVEKGFDGMLEPYLDSGTMMTSYVTPIERGGKRVGAVGIDLALRDLDARIKRVKVLDSGYAFVASNSGLLVAFPRQKGWTGKQTLSRSRSRHVRAWRASPPPQGRSRGPRRDDRPGDGQGRRAVLRAGEDRRLELRRGRAQGRDARRRQAPAHDADPARPARAAARVGGVARR